MLMLKLKKLKTNLRKIKLIQKRFFAKLDFLKIKLWKFKLD